ncbi:hypothetical protein FPSE_10894 [Fusarium pseudograminearum CS3096]|uniref:ribonuclease H n=1 Tax=Fusarium pseudograminearum (strain CS3096) TaxID=1028729 RepID=K3V6G1_FUSPC|nr:hypothetical protein FPSE_10894 [Fusarium pseudograminearum CS3096]EKJ68917.1 hypothetical protein FPSE_10894 [Fusarium pseudograminearum CS3096]KAF0638242.1 hypothetical protein FPSE5266_10894 [Fusarium pseudograminearum]
MESYNMILQFPGVDELLQSPSEDETELALQELWNMLKKDRTDPLRLSDIIPHVLLQLGEDQKCYDFIKWWLLHGSESPSGRPDSPFFDIQGANACEPLKHLELSNASLSHLVALTLLKLRLYMDLDAISDRHFDTSMGFDDDGPSMDRDLGEIAEEIFETTKKWSNLTGLAGIVKTQYIALRRRVNEANPQFWEALATEKPSSGSSSEDRGPGSRDEADLVLYHCRRAWDNVEDAMVTIDDDTAHYVRAYTGPAERNERKPLGKHRGTGRVFPTGITYVASSHPNKPDILSSINIDKTRGRLLLGKQSSLLLYTDGSCLNNGQSDARGGWSVSFGTDDPHLGSSAVSGRLEEMGPFGDREKATSNRAELRAVIAALRLSDWKKEGFTSVVIATDSTYVLSGATKWAKAWVSNRWRLHDGTPVKNKDLWELLLGEVERWDNEGVEVCLLNIPRHLNQEADEAARVAATIKPDKTKFTDITLSAKPKLQPYILAVCLNPNQLCQDYDSILSSNQTLKVVYSPKIALECLNGPEPPSMILITDPTFIRYRDILERTIDRMRDGATVVLSSLFANVSTSGEISRFFNTVGLPWGEGNYQGASLKLSTRVIDQHLTKGLKQDIRINSSFVKGVTPSESWYIDPDVPGQAAVAFTKLGLGRLGYIGCTDDSEGAIVAGAMFGMTAA